MLRTTIRLDLDSDYVLNDVTREFDRPIVVTHEEVHDDGTLTFVAEVPEQRDEIAARLAESSAVERVGTAGETTLFVRKRSCGAIPVIRRHNGMLHGVDRALGTERVFDVLAFSRADIRDIVEGLEAIGTPHVEKLSRVPDRPSGLSRRQQEAVETAIEAGYYDWPRGADAETVASELGITHPTFLEHLRKAEKKLLTRALAAPAADESERSVR
ncbi:bacterio-opsin activator [Halorubrum sp. JWXQ-INN 858]|uniref:helix-turn-helix domain-containing protein n=1 Tax=Halorubrum sp. JWXQ-INN 858 TaxID=2690782 RepID=UPI001357A4D6|nr:helix-turn-helix domain-containing protein [Halorubrum sp. JWXQ-INN 858]MWV65098.1 bacterio-opsin activator [Halorubrum sp. JWXQ-INN 858]